MTPTEVHTQITGEELAQTFEAETPEVELSGYAIEDWVTFALFWVMALAVFLQFFTRYVLNDIAEGRLSVDRWRCTGDGKRG